jgi:hypothetical protein
MRTKTLLLTAALSAAGVATSMAQSTVFSVNAVGYVNTVIPKNNNNQKQGFALISNPLTATDNSIGALFKGGIQGAIPDGLQVYKFNGTGFTIASYDELSSAFTPASAAAVTVVPGEGVFVRNPSNVDITVTFVGEVPQGTLKNPVPKGLSIRSSMVPQSGTAAALGYTGTVNDQIYQYKTATQTYGISTLDEFSNQWTPPLGTLNVGEAIFIRAQAATSWDRTFNVNQ